MADACAGNLVGGRRLRESVANGAVWVTPVEQRGGSATAGVQRVG